METPVSETSHFPVRLMSFLHSTLKRKCKYLVFTVIAAKMWRPDATPHAKRPTQEVNLARLRSRMPAATFLRKTMIKARVRGPSLFDVYGSIDSIHARAIIGRKRGQAGIGTKLVGVKLLNTLQQVSKLTSTNWPIKMRDYPNHSGKMLQEWNRRLCAWCWR